DAASLIGRGSVSPVRPGFFDLTAKRVVLPRCRKAIRSSETGHRSAPWLVNSRFGMSQGIGDLHRKTACAVIRGGRTPRRDIWTTYGGYGLVPKRIPCVVGGERHC